MSKVDLSGNYVLDKSENFDAFLKALNVGLVHRTMACKVKPTVEIVQKGDEFVIKTCTSLRSQQQIFRVGEEFKSNITWSDKDTKVRAYWEGDKLVISPVEEDKNLPILTREIQDGRLILTQQIGNVVAKRYFVSC
ncbi:fatty acid-binding protein, brain-like [Anneissia japonica]|uniref:fatty acid-binding protein, brain-like n=1 Tax=Anneissia japonica TaxID=1529436 RepID=UPI0014255A50|nr:fatty acid-binding protein, brain-like [Anneissia japonica]